MKRFTISPGVRFDYTYTGWEAFHVGPAPLVPTRNIDFADQPWYQFKDLSPRVSMSDQPRDPHLDRPDASGQPPPSRSRR